MNDVDFTPVRDQHGVKRPYPNGDVEYDPEMKRFDQERHVISQFTRDDLEDKYLRMYEDNIILKKHARKQEDKIKKLAAKLLRLVNDRKRVGITGRQLESENKVEELEQRVLALDRQNQLLKDKLQLSKQQLSAQGKRHTPYDHVQSRINSGIVRSSAPSEPKRSSRVLSPHHGHGRVESARLNASGGMPRYGHSLLEESRAENRRLEQVIGQLNEQINMHEHSIEDLKEQVRVKEAEFEEDVLRIKQQASAGQRIAIQENMDLIKLQRDLKEKSAMLTAVHAKYQSLESKMATAEASHAQLMREIDRLNEEVKLKEQQNLQLDSDVKQSHSSQRRVIEMEHYVEDLKRDNAVLKDANEKLMSNAFDTAREREWREKEQALRTQIAQLEATMKRDVGEKGEVLTRLEQERDKSDLAEHELSSLRVRFYELQQQYDELADKMKFFTKESAVDMSEIEDALVLVKQKREKGYQNLEFLNQVDDESNQDLKKRLQEAEAAHADTIQELEKTRSMLIVQYKINNDYKRELDSVNARSDEVQAESDLKLSEYAKLLDIRATRIRKLQKQLKDVAYGTRQFRVPAVDGEMEADEADSVVSDDIALQRGENIVEIHVGKMVLNDSAIKLLDERDPQLFCTWDFYEFETQATAVMRGVTPDFDLTAQYAVRVDDFFLHYLQKDSTTLELHQVVGSEYRTVGACQLSCRALLDSRRGQLHATAQLLSLDGESGEALGMIEYWIRLRVPMDQALRLYRERTKALGYLNTNEKATGEALRALDDAAAERPEGNVNNLHTKLIRCQGIKARRSDMQPSVYCVYKFFDFPDHDTTIIPSTQSPEFHDHKTFPVHMTPDLDRYLKTQPLDIFMFDDTDPEEASYLGKATIPLIPLVHNKPVVGSFEMISPNGESCGTVEVALKWQYNYMPAHVSARTEALEATAAAMAKSPGAGSEALSSVVLLPGEEEEMKPLPSVSRQIRPERDVGPQRGSPIVRSPQTVPESQPKPVQQPIREIRADEADERVETPPLVPIQMPTKGILKKTGPQKQGTVADRFNQLPDAEKPQLDDMEIRDSDSVAHTEASEDDVNAKGKIPSAHVDRARDRQNALRSSLETLERTQPSDMTTVTDQTSDMSQTVTSVTRDEAASESSSEASPYPVGTNNRGPIAPPRASHRVGPEKQGSISDNGSDSDAVVIATSTRRSAELRDSTGALVNPTDTAVIEIGYFQIEDDAPLLLDSQVKLLYVEYNFLENIVETPVGLPKPSVKDRNKKLSFNFRKSFPVDFDNHYEQRQYLASMLMEEYSDFSKFISFTVLSEPSDEEDQSGECIEQGFADIDIRKIMQQQKDIENELIPVVLPSDKERVIGQLCVSVKCLAAMHAVKEEIQGFDAES